MSDQISSIENLVDETVSEAVPNVGAQLRAARKRVAFSFRKWLPP